MKSLPFDEVKASFSATVGRAEQGEPTVITRHGRPAAVVVPWATWERLNRIPSLGALLMAAPIEPGDIPERDGSGARKVEF